VIADADVAKFEQAWLRKRCWTALEARPRRDRLQGLRSLLQTRAVARRGRRARIASVTSFAVSAQACVPPLPYCFTASPTHHSPSMPVSRGKSNRRRLASAGKSPAIRRLRGFL